MTSLRAEPVYGMVQTYEAPHSLRTGTTPPDTGNAEKSSYGANSGVSWHIPAAVERLLSQAEAPAHADFDPSPEVQRAGFEAVVAEGRPTTVQVKEALEWLERIASMADTTPGGFLIGSDVREVASLIDRLGCALIAQDTELDEANRALDVVASAAIPLDDADMAELVQEARQWVERVQRKTFHDHDALATVITRLVVALLAQARKTGQAKVDRELANRAMIEAEGGQGKFRRLVERIAKWTDAELCAVDAEQTRHIARLVRDGADLIDYPPFAHKATNLETFDITKPMDPRQDALLAVDVLSRFAGAKGPLTVGDASRIVKAIRRLLAEHDMMEMHRDAARDVVSDLEAESRANQAARGESQSARAALIAERDDALRDAESDRQNLAVSVASWLWVHETAACRWVPASLRAEHWGGPIGTMAEALVEYLRDRVIQLEATAQEDPAPVYTEAMRAKAAASLSVLVMRRKDADTLGATCLNYVDLVAQALGMRKADA